MRQPGVACSIRGAAIATVLITRPEPEASATARRLATAGHRAIVSPLLVWRAVAWGVPEDGFDGVLITSARALDAGPVAAIAHLPAHTVGPATSTAARRAGFMQVHEGPGGGGQAVLDALPPGNRRLLWLAAQARTALVAPPCTELVPVTTYAMDLAPLTAEASSALAAHAVDWAVLTSARAARHFAAEVDRIGTPRVCVGVGAISAAVLAAAGHGWRAGVAAPAATEDALLAALALY